MLDFHATPAERRQVDELYRERTPGYDVKIHDPSIIKLLKQQAAKGVTIRVIGSMKGRDPGIAEFFNRLSRHHTRQRHGADIEKEHGGVV